jgi:DNA-binding PadR family transcriptional regulator
MSIRHALLGLLAQRPRHGYELRAAFAAVVGGEESWDVKPAQIYMTLERLAEAGWVCCDSNLGEGQEPSRRIYAITPQGHSALQAWFNSGVPSEHQRDSFFVKLITAVVAGEKDLQRILQVQRASLYRELHALTALRGRLNARVELAQILLLDKAIMHTEADIRWLDFIEVRLDEICRQPIPEPELRPRGRPRKNVQSE